MKKMLLKKLFNFAGLLVAYNRYYTLRSKIKPCIKKAQRYKDLEENYVFFRKPYDRNI